MRKQTPEKLNFLNQVTFAPFYIGQILNLMENFKSVS